MVLHQATRSSYRRGDTHLVVVNPRREPARAELPDVRAVRALLTSGAEVSHGAVEVDGFGYGVFELERD